MKTICITGTFDTKGKEYAYVKSVIEGLGCKTFTINTGAGYEPYFEPDVSSDEVARAGGSTIKEVMEGDRAFATATMAKGMEVIVPKYFKEGKFDGIISFGGSGGTSIATPGMRQLPIGVPKLMVSTIASGDTSIYVGTSDIIMMPSIVDVEGINSFSTTIFNNAAMAIVGMVKLKDELPEHHEKKKPLVTATMFGVTTPCIKAAKEYLEKAGYEVLVFHATGTGGRTMEALVKAGFIKGVLDMTTTEWCDELFGGILAAGEDRCEAAAKAGVPTVMSVGALDMVNFGAYDTVPEQFAGRNLFRHNPTITLMRTTVEENKQLGAKLAEKLNMYQKDTALFLPLKGLSAIDVEGAAFYGPEEDKALYDTLKADIKNDKVEIIEMDTDINDKAFAEAAAQKLIDLMQKA